MVEHDDLVCLHRWDGIFEYHSCWNIDKYPPPLVIAFLEINSRKYSSKFSFDSHYLMPTNHARTWCSRSQQLVGGGCKIEGGTNIPPLPFLTFDFINNFFLNNLAVQSGSKVCAAWWRWMALSYFFIFSSFNNASCSLVPVVNSKRHMQPHGLSCEWITH